jgi:NADPH2:quinone reductase
MMMQALLHTPGPDACVRLGEMVKPTVRPGEVLIRVAYAGVNRPDLLQLKGSYPPPPGASPLLGLEVSGTVVAMGEGVDTLSIGQAVCALTPGGGYAEFVVVPAGHCAPVPEGLSLLQAAAIPETYMTVWANVIERGRLEAKETLLIHGGSSGIGITAIQIAKWRGANVMTTVGSEEKAAACRRLGADHVINYTSVEWPAVVRDLTKGCGVNMILDMVGGDYIEKNLRSLAIEGRLVQIAFLNGSKVDIDWMPLMLKRLTFTGSTLRARPEAEKTRLMGALRNAIWPELSSGRLLPVIHQVFPMAQASEAHALMASSRHIGKIMLHISDDTT